MLGNDTLLPRRVIKLDPRTKLFVLAVTSTVLLTGGYGGALEVVRPVLMSLALALLLTGRKFALAGGYACAVVIAEAIQYATAIYGGFLGAAGALLLLICGFALRLAPGIAVGYYLTTTTTVSELVAGLDRMRAPQNITIPLAVMFRFVPTLFEEIVAIGQAVRMRSTECKGILPSAEFRLVPLMMCSVRIGEDLSASALTRGLGAPCKRTSISSIGFGFADAIVAVICTGCISALFVL